MKKIHKKITLFTIYYTHVILLKFFLLRLSWYLNKLLLTWHKKLESNDVSYPDKTIATASLRTLSPNTNAYKSTSTLRSLKIAKTVTIKNTQTIHIIYYRK